MTCCLTQIYQKHNYTLKNLEMVKWSLHCYRRVLQIIGRKNVFSKVLGKNHEKKCLMFCSLIKYFGMLGSSCRSSRRYILIYNCDKLDSYGMDNAIIIPTPKVEEDILNNK